jgi:hypothetical protein
MERMRGQTNQVTEEAGRLDASGHVLDSDVERFGEGRARCRRCWQTQEGQMKTKMVVKAEKGPVWVV